MFYIPHNDLRDFRATTETCKLRAIGKTRKIAEIEKQEILREKMAWSSKLKLAKSGLNTFGTVSYLLFKKKISEKMGKDIPQLLSSFNINGGVDLAASSFKAILSFKAICAFIAYEAKIAEQKKIIHMLRTEKRIVAIPVSADTGLDYGSLWFTEG
jgi:hypothetical protein